MTLNMARKAQTTSKPRVYLYHEIGKKPRSRPASGEYLNPCTVPSKTLLHGLKAYPKKSEGIIYDPSLIVCLPD